MIKLNIPFGFNLNKIAGLIIILLNFLTLVPFQSYAQPLAEGRSKFVGNIIGNGNNIHSNFSKYWNQVTAENAGKWGSVEFSPGSYNWTQLDKIYNYALANNFPYRHHNLIWGQQQPGFMNTLDSAAQYLEIENWIKATGERYPEADFCDVVNEPLHAPPSYKNALGGDGATGWDWVIKAFELARQYWPNTKLFINEYSVINDGSANTQYLQIINLLKDRGLIDGIGIQGHHFSVDGGASLNTLRTNLTKLTATGLPIHVTEFDINREDDNTQLQRYKAIFPLLYENPGVYGITLWGYIQYETWRDYTYLLTDRFAERPAMEWLKTYFENYLRTTLISPLATTGEPRNTLLIWNSSSPADSYNIQIAADSNFSSLIIDSTLADTLLQLDSLTSETDFYWHVKAFNESDTGSYSETAKFTTGKLMTDVTDFKKIPVKFSLAQNYPNPFNPETQIEYSLPHDSRISLKIYNLLGEKVATLFEGFQNEGRYSIVFNADKLASGIYLYRLTADNFMDTKKLIVLK